MARTKRDRKPPRAARTPKTSGSTSSSPAPKKRAPRVGFDGDDPVAIALDALENGPPLARETAAFDMRRLAPDEGIARARELYDAEEQQATRRVLLRCLAILGDRLALRELLETDALHPRLVPNDAVAELYRDLVTWMTTDPGADAVRSRLRQLGLAFSTNPALLDDAGAHGTFLAAVLRAELPLLWHAVAEAAVAHGALSALDGFHLTARVPPSVTLSAKPHGVDQERLAQAVMDELQAATDASAVVKRAGLPHSAIKLEAHARRLLLAIIDDGRLPERTRVEAVTVLLAFPDVDVAAAVLARAGRAAPTAAQMVEAAERLDPIEAYEALCEPYRASAEVRQALANRPAAARDARFVDEALGFVATEPRAACRLLRACGERGRMELLDIVEKAQSMHDIARAACDELRALADDGAMAAVADLIRRTR